MTPASIRGTGPRPVVAVVVATWLVAFLVSCGSDGATPVSTLVIPDTIALGDLPEAAGVPEPPSIPGIPAASTSTTTTTVPEPEPIDGPIGAIADGPRVLLIGDTVLAATAPRFGGIMCTVLPELGWQVEIDAEPGRFVDFANRVLDERLDVPGEPAWDVFGVMFGNHYDDDIGAFEQTLDDVLARLSPRPVILYTVTESVDVPAEVNTVIRQRAERSPNVVLVDWDELTAAEPEKLLDGDGLHLTEAGAGRLVIFTAAALGDAPADPLSAGTAPAGTDPAATDPAGTDPAGTDPAGTDPADSTVSGGACLPTSFADDSAIVL